jgi:hypothetical protein
MYDVCTYLGQKERVHVQFRVRYMGTVRFSGLFVLVVNDCIVRSLGWIRFISLGIQVIQPRIEVYTREGGDDALYSG